VHPSLITKLVTRIGAVRGDFRVAVVAWDFDGTRLTQRWKWLRNRGISFHQLRIVDVDGDGRDDVADGNYVVSSDGTFRYEVPQSTHGDRFHIGDLDPARPGLEGYAIQQTEGGVWTNFPWYYYDAATGERLTTGAHPDVERDEALWDIPRGTAADIDPRTPGYEFWAATDNQELPGAGVWNVNGQRVSTHVPSVNFRIWWDGDTLSELLDFTFVEKWDYTSETTRTLFEPSGVVPSWRNAVPLYGDLLGDWREEFLAETAEHTALRLFTTTIPTETRLYTLAQNPAYRLGFTVRGYLQSLLPDFYLGAETSSAGGGPPRPPIQEAGVRTPIFIDGFRSGLTQWTPELQAGGRVAAENGVLDIDVPAGATVWLNQPLSEPYEIEYTATPIAAGGPNDHVTDLNVFWNARDARSPDDVFATARSGAFADYDWLETYYVGQGANLNTTTRFRRYVGEPGNRPLIFDLTEPLIRANQPVRIKISVLGDHVRYYSDDQLVFDHVDPEPYRSGWFAFRTVGSHFAIRDFGVWRPAP
jgi:rhamnogalacturonan endolyase